MLRFYYAYVSWESIGNVFQKATGVGWFGDRYLDGFLGVASLIATCVSFIESITVGKMIYILSYFGLTGECAYAAVECAQAGKTAHMLNRRAIKHHCN